MNITFETESLTIDDSIYILNIILNKYIVFFNCDGENRNDVIQVLEFAKIASPVRIRLSGYESVFKQSLPPKFKDVLTDSD